MLPLPTPTPPPREGRFPQGKVPTGVPASQEPLGAGAPGGVHLNFVTAHTPTPEYCTLHLNPAPYTKPYTLHLNPAPCTWTLRPTPEPCALHLNPAPYT